MADHPYASLDRRAFWRTAVSDVSALELSELYVPRFPINKNMRIAAAGSCFAQHIGRHFKRNGYKYLDLEPPPAQLAAEDHERFGFGLYSARYGNIYSARQLLQLFQRAYGEFEPAETVWERNGRYYDPFRPSIEPEGFASEDELKRDVAYHLAQVRKLLEEAHLFVFTFGLTETWIVNEDGAVLPTCPGTVAGEFDSERYRFHNFSFNEILLDMVAFIKFALSINPKMRFLFTVSPVPLTATASGAHVLSATTYSKSVLRAACGELYNRFGKVEYFPSYELVASHPMRSVFFHPNLRSVSTLGVEHVMNVFFRAHLGEQPRVPVPDRGWTPDNDDDVVCDEAILETFSR